MKKVLLGLVLGSAMALPAAFADVNSDAEAYGQQVLNNAISMAKGANSNSQSIATVLKDSNMAKFDTFAPAKANQVGDIDPKACSAEMNQLQDDASAFSSKAINKEYKSIDGVDGNKVMGALSLVADAIVDGSNLIYNVCQDTPTGGYFFAKAYDFALTTGNDYFNNSAMPLSH